LARLLHLHLQPLVARERTAAVAGSLALPIDVELVRRLARARRAT
jgi:hypothetical protein